MKSTQEKILISLGIWLLILPFLGFPQSWKTLLTLVTGLVIIYIGALLLKYARDRREALMQERRTETFTETTEPAA